MGKVFNGADHGALAAGADDGVLVPRRDGIEEEATIGACLAERKALPFPPVFSARNNMSGKDVYLHVASCVAGRRPARCRGQTRNRE